MRPERCPSEHTPAGTLERILGGAWQEDRGRRWFAVERRLDPDTRHGRERIGDLAVRHERSAALAPVLTGGAPAQPPFLFFDLETTGLAGGAGTFAFLVGLGRFDGDGAFVTRQYVMTAIADERPILDAVTGDLAGAGALVSFNGKSFDAPLLEMRYLFHRLEWRGEHLPHIDVLHLARRFWRDGRDEENPCSLSIVERQVLGARRAGDVPGLEIPGRYFHFVRSGDARPLVAVLEHNRLDLVALAGLHARLLAMVDGGPAAARDPREALALGRLYGRAGLEARARAAFEHVLSMDCTAAIRLESLRWLALSARRARRFDESAGYWIQLLDEPECAGHLQREAAEALAIYHEHRARDLVAARSFALRSIEADSRPAWNDRVRHRLGRIQRKIERAGNPGLLAY